MNSKRVTRHSDTWILVNFAWESLPLIPRHWPALRVNNASSGTEEFSNFLNFFFVHFFFWCFFPSPRRSFGSDVGEGARSEPDIGQGGRQRGNPVWRQRQPAAANRVETVLCRPDHSGRRRREGFQRRVAVPHQNTTGARRQLHVPGPQELGSHADARLDRSQYATIKLLTASVVYSNTGVLFVSSYSAARSQGHAQDPIAKTRREDRHVLSRDRRTVPRGTYT